MNILIVSLLKRNVAPDTLSSRPRIIFELTRGLIENGHDVTFLGTGDSFIPGAKMIPVISQAFVKLPSFENPFYAETSYLVQLEKKIEELAPRFDIIHNHTYPEFINLFATERVNTPIVTTIHAQGTPELDAVLSLFPKTYFISISEAHKRLFKKTNIYKVVYNGIDTNLYQYSDKKEDYLLWLGRLSKAKNSDGSYMDPKGIRTAIELAEKTGARLLLSGNVEDGAFFEQDVKPHLNDKIQWVGPVSAELSLSKNEVASLMQKAKAFLMPINWYEPFGLVMAEAGSCGTPVIAFDRGSVRELIIDGKTGFIVAPEKGVEGFIEAYDKIGTIRPGDCRNHIVSKFSTQHMVENYEKTYHEIIQKK